ncbi:RICIN domain-containing protein [Bradyrhizobium symbiodeficiens]|uniref:Ricin-type beta-trefoil lectin domain protein n=1 Tax=Bradyrhizobium symbiodeficiens TaxID=1404367 RepID=A0A6G9AAX6_9BRAD|nr:ricin-type beta-trefoil lectin domain protein [Bradyrhizobium symbiodeficiens]QIP09601.1 ricin-type beta-trefoil lectin domain protein [Bradyrhizobium symbiodeficiens]
MQNSYLCLVLGTLSFTLASISPNAASAFEDVNMGSAISVEGGHIVARWDTRGFHHYNIRWSANGGPEKQVERAGDKSFVYLTPYQPGVLYSISVQGCDKNFASSSKCTSWDGASCGNPRNPCTGPIPMPIKSRGGLCLDVDAPNQRVNGGRVQVWACNGSDQQLWSINGGRIVSLAGKCLDAHLPDIHKNGGRIQVWDCNNSAQQNWRQNRLELRNGGGKCLDVHAPMLHQNGGIVQLWQCNGTIQQSWSQPGLL